jgi:ABC-2 type transport system ATP-binding protein
MSNPIVEFHQVSKRYFHRKAVEDVSFALPRGKIIGLIGENGSGKSTLLKLMAGLIRPSSGHIQVNGKPVSRRISADVAFLSDAETLYPFYTVDETLRFYNGVYSDFDLEKAHQVADFMELDRSLRVKSLSKGTYGRLKIVLALARKAPLIVMDEPLSGLDPLVRASIIRGMISFVDLETQTLVMSTHEVSEVEPVLDVAMMMSKGHLHGIVDLEAAQTQYETGLIGWMKDAVTR